MSGEASTPRGSRGNNTYGTRIILLIGAGSAAIYLALTLVGDLPAHPVPFLGGFALLAGLMFAAWRLLERDPAAVPIVFVAALLFRMIVAFGPPSLSDDVYRYVWDGRVQVHGFHPYEYSPDDPVLLELRDENWAAINHPELKTIYPPLAEILFRIVAWIGLGPLGFKLLMGLVDCLVVLALDRLLRAASLPRGRVVLYAWNPLAIFETGGSGHLEPVGVLFTLVAGIWIIKRRGWLSTLPLAAGIHIKLLPAVLLPAALRRGRLPALAILAVAIWIPFLPFISGPWIGEGLLDYAERWEYNATLFSVAHAAIAWLDTGVTLKPLVAFLQERIGEGTVPWDRVYEHIWPAHLARGLVAVLAGIWVLYVSFRRRFDFVREALWILGGVLLLSPTLHPWYLLWLLPWAAARASWGWLVLAATVALAYAGRGQDVSVAIKCMEYLPAAAAFFLVRRYRNRTGASPSASIAP